MVAAFHARAGRASRNPLSGQRAWRSGGSVTQAAGTSASNAEEDA